MASVGYCCAGSTERQIEATDRWVDELVYELCNLTDEEIKIVGGATAD